MDIIRSKSNQLIKQTKKLLQKKYRKTSYLIEGWHLLEEAQKAGAQIEQIFVTEEGLGRLDQLRPGQAGQPGGAGGIV
jgi:TrmH family RNA methyltransferase